MGVIQPYVPHYQTSPLIVFSSLQQLLSNEALHVNLKFLLTSRSQPHSFSASTQLESDAENARSYVL